MWPDVRSRSVGGMKRRSRKASLVGSRCLQCDFWRGAAKAPPFCLMEIFPRAPLTRGVSHLLCHTDASLEVTWLVCSVEHAGNLS